MGSFHLINLFLIAAFTIQKSSAATNEGPSECKDEVSNCHELIKYCESLDHMKKFCSKTCGACQENNSCKCGTANEPERIFRPFTGQRNRIVGGQEALKNKYPWLVSIVMVYRGRGIHCGGSIINTRYILTAGHCTYAGLCTNPFKAEDIYVSVAEHNVWSMSDDVRGVTERMKVKKVIRHSDYCLEPRSPTSYNNDIAILQLPNDLELSHKELGLACLPENTWSTYEGKTVTVAGWGLNQPTGAAAGTRAENLLEVSFKVMNDCREYRFRQHITANMMCAGDPVAIKDSCGGDSGGPLVYKDENNRYVQVGIVSFGPPGGNCTGVGVYTHVAHYIGWIRENTKDGLCNI